MSLLGNIIWFILGGWISGLSWLVSGVIWCITIVGIPYGLQCFKFASLAASPFGKDVEYGGGVPMAIENFLLGCIFCITIIGIPFGVQYFKIAKLSLAPFGAEIVNYN